MKINRKNYNYDLLRTLTDGEYIFHVRYRSEEVRLAIKDDVNYEGLPINCKMFSFDIMRKDKLLIAILTINGVALSKTIHEKNIEAMFCWAMYNFYILRNDRKRIALEFLDLD